MNTGYSLGNRVIALALSIIMVLGMLPASAVATDNTVEYGVVEGLSDGITITGGNAETKATFKGTLDWVPADSSIGRVQDGWWAGIKVTAPATLNMEKAQYKSGTKVKSFKEYKESADDAQTHYMTMWCLVNEAKLRSANLTDGLVTYTLTFDWDGDDVFEQTVVLEFDADQTVLVNDLGTTVYPAAPIGYGALEMITSGATISGNETAAIGIGYNNDVTIAWQAADASVGRDQDGWWAGMKILAPAGMTEDQVKNVQYISGSVVKSFWDDKDSAEGADRHFMTMWVPLNNLLSGDMAPSTYQFDWNNDGLFEQRAVMSVDASKITLTKGGVQVYPVLGQVSSYHGGAVTGSGTSEVSVLIDDVTLNWSPADASIGRTQGWWVGIKVESPVGMTADKLQSAVYQRKTGPAADWSADNSFWSNKDSADGDEIHNIQLWFPVTPASIEQFKNENRNITMWYQFDWDHNGTYEQKITFSVDPTGNIVLNKAAQTGFAFEHETPDDIWVGEGSFTNVASGGQSGGEVTYEIIAGSDIASVDSEGKVTFTGIGTVTVQATLAGDSEGYYYDATAQYSITAVKKEQAPKFTYTNPSVITYAPNAVFTNALTGVMGGDVRYEIIDEDINGSGVATIDANNGQLTILKAGTVTVKATVSGNAQYNETEVAPYTLVIQKAEQEGFAFDNAPVELTWQSAAVAPFALKNGFGEGAVSWEITSGNDVATVSADGEITLLKAGTFTIQAQKAGDDCYNDSAVISATVLVNPAEQTDFGFGETETVTVTYNDSNNKYTLAATGGQSSKDVVYTVISGDAATVDNNGVVSIVKAGTVVIEATKPADEQYKAISDTYTLTINKDENKFGFENGNEIAVKYGTESVKNPLTDNASTGVVTYEISENTVGATIDQNGVVSFADSEAKVGSFTVTVSRAADECYLEHSDSYTVTVAYLEKPAADVTVTGPTLNESGWYTGKVELTAPAGYQVSYANKLSTNDWADSVEFDTEGADKAATVYLKDSNGYMTDAIVVAGINIDTVNPEKLAISYTKPTWAVVLENLTFGLYQSDKLNVTISAEDKSSGIASLTYNVGDEDIVVPVNGVASASHSFTIDAQFRNKIVLTAMDVSGRQSKLEDEIIVVLDTKNPDIVVEYVYASGAHREDNGIFYTQKDTVITFKIDESNFDLSGLEILDANGQKTCVPIVAVNGAETAVTWTKVAGTTEWEGDLTLSGNGDYVVTVSFTDPANNAMETYQQEVHIDDTIPEISVSYDNNAALNGNHYNTDRIAKVQIQAHNFKAELVELEVTAQDITGSDVNISAKDYTNYAKNPANWTAAGDVWTLNTDGMKFDIDAIYKIALNYSDLCGNAAEAYTAEFVVDKTKADNIKIEYSTPLLEKLFEIGTFGFYRADVEVKVTAEDMTSGVDFFEITYNQLDGANTTNKPTYKTEKLAAVQDATNKRVFTATHTIKPEARGTVSVDVTDKAGHLNVKADGKVLVLDTIKPGLVDVKYVFENDQNREYNNIFYTQGETKVQFTIDEANFDLALLTASDETRSAAPLVTVNGVEQSVVWDQKEGTNKWLGEVVLTGNGDYVVAMTFEDRSKNDKLTFSKEIHIDDDAPVIEVTYDNNAARNENQYKADRTAIISIQEHNFNPAEVSLNVTALNILDETVDITSKGYEEYAKDPANWTRVGDVWTLNTADMKFDIDAIYTITLNYSDLCGNAADEYTTKFVVDKTNPENIKIAYSESVFNEILAKLFYRDEVEVKITAEDITAGVEHFVLTYTREDGVSVTNKDTFTTEQLPAKQDPNQKNVFTASYKIPAQARGTVSILTMDRAGNEITTSESTVLVVDKLTPTREVSFAPYKVLNAATMLEVDEYAEGDNVILYYKDNAVVTFEITEANFDLSLLNEATKPVIKVNNVPVNVTWTPNGDTWTATHTIEGDGDYVVTMSYKDLSTNEMVDYESFKIAIDGKEPEVSVKYVDGVETQTIDGIKYYKNTQTAEIQITEHNFRADEVALTVTAVDVQENPVDISSKAYAEYAKDRANWTSNGDVHTLNTAGMVFDIDAMYTFDIVYDDICDNYIEDYEQDQFVVDHEDPTDLEITYSTSIIGKIIEHLTFGFYQPEVTVTLTANDATSGVDFFDWTYTKQVGTSDEHAEDNGGRITSHDTNFAYSNAGKTATASFTVPASARGHIAAVVTDRAGNDTEKIDDALIKVVDEKKPEITVNFEPNNADTKAQFVNAENTTVNQFAQGTKAYFNGDVTAKIVIDEANFFDGVTAEDVATGEIGVIHQVGIKLTKTYDDETVEVIEYLPVGAVQKYAEARAEYFSWIQAGDLNTLHIPYTDNADYVLEIEYTDLSLNDAHIVSNDGQSATKYYASKQVTVDKTAPVVTVKYSNTNVINTIDNREYLDDIQTATITIEEHNFRAADMMAVVSAVDVVNSDVAVANFAAQLADQANWTRTEGTDIYTATVVYNVDANYTFDYTFKDLAENPSADYEQDLFTVDKTAPVNLKATYSTHVFQEILESITFGYYNATMTVTISADDATSGIHHFAYSYIKSEGVSDVNAELLDQAIQAAEIRYEGATATASFEIPKMVLQNDNQFNGTVEFTAFDRSENSTELVETNRIIVDNISPTSTITYNNPVQNANGISYYNGNIQATIVINEANFDAEDVNVNVTRDNANHPVNVTWESTSVDRHVGTFVLTQDGDYIVSVQYRDKSGNQMNNYASNQLTLDTTAPTIHVSNIVANSANKDAKYGFEITFDDININVNSMNPVLLAVMENENGLYGTKQIDLGAPITVVAGKTYAYRVEDLPDDALYTLSYEVLDMSGNRTINATLDDGNVYGEVEFSINRNGSTFGFGDAYAAGLVEQYYVYEVYNDVVIVEVNVDPINHYSVMLNGEELTEGEDYTSEQTSNNGEWSKRTYTINKGLFAAEGEYSIIVSSTDKASSVAYSDIKNLAIAFVVDQTAPVITISGLANGGRYQTDEQTVTLMPSDEGGRLNSLRVVVFNADGEPLTDDNGNDISLRFDMSGEDLLAYLDERDGRVTFTVPKGLNNQVQIICTDCAENANGDGNEYNETFTRVTVSQNQLVIFYANTPVFLGTIAGVAAMITLIIVGVKRKKANSAAKKENAKV